MTRTFVFAFNFKGSTSTALITTKTAKTAATTTTTSLNECSKKLPI